MTLLEILILGIVEGLTEFLPVSSTGHLILTQQLLGIHGRGADVYTIVIQLGAILAVLALYRERALQMIMGLLGRDAAGLGLFLKLLVAFIPAVIAGLTLEDLIDAHLFHALPVVAALIVGGIAMIVVEKYVVAPHAAAAEQGTAPALRTIEQMTCLDAVLIGCAQCLALWPGTSRSMATILGAQLRGFSDRDAAELSFLLALPTLGGATVYKLIKEREILVSEVGWTAITLGNVVAFVVAFLAVRWFVGIVTRHGMVPFGIYRIVIGVVFLLLWLAGFVSVSQ